MPTSTPEAISDREAEVLVAVGEHLSNAAIAERLFISVRTVESHVSSLLRKFGVADRRALAALTEATTHDDLAPDPFADDRSPLPHLPTSFIGRARELGLILDAIADCPLVTLVGPGGAGKTRLAVHVASDRPSLFVDLSAVAADADADTIGRAVARRLPMHEPARRPTDAVARHLAASPRLLVLDNCEHLLQGAATFSAAVAEQPGTHVLATSRERLAVAAETVVPVGPIDLDDAVALFTQRAQAVDPGADLDRARVEELCRRLDRIPLAIELAAARLGALDLADLLERLDDALDLLGGGDRTNSRHRSIRATIDWSHALLEPDTQALHRRLSVLPGPFRLAVAEAVGSAPGEPSVASRLAQLVDASLLERRGARYRQLELVRADAGERLDLADDRDRTWACLVDWAVAAASEPLVDGDENDLLASVRAAERLDHPALGTLTAAMAPTWAANGNGADAQRLYELAADRTGDPGYAVAGAELARSRWQGDTAMDLFRLVAELGTRRDDPASVATGLAGAVEVAGRFAGAVRDIPDTEVLAAMVQDAAGAAQRTDDADGCLAARVAIAAAFVDMHALHGSEDPLATGALAAAEVSGGPILISSALDALTVAQANAGENEACMASILRRFSVLGDVGDSPRATIERVDNLLMASDAALRVGEFDASLTYAESLREIEVERGFPHSGLARVAIASFFLCLWDECLAETEALRAFWERDQRPRAGWIGTPFACAAAIHGYRGDDDGAARWFQLATDATVVSPSCHDVQNTLAADVHLHHGRLDRARSIVRDPTPPARSWWPGLTAAVRAEALGGDVVAVAEAYVDGDPYGTAIVHRGTGDHAAAVVGFERCGSPYQVARTALRSGATGPAADAAVATYAALGLVVPPS